MDACQVYANLKALPKLTQSRLTIVGHMAKGTDYQELFENLIMECSNF